MSRCDFPKLNLDSGGREVLNLPTMMGAHPASSGRESILLFRWFKFTLKPPYSITHGKLKLAIWNTSFCTFLSNLDTRDLETYPRTYSGHF